MDNIFILPGIVISIVLVIIVLAVIERTANRYSGYRPPDDESRMGPRPPRPVRRNSKSMENREYSYSMGCFFALVGAVIAAVPIGFRLSSVFFNASDLYAKSRFNDFVSLLLVGIPLFILGIILAFGRTREPHG